MEPKRADAVAPPPAAIAGEPAGGGGVVESKTVSSPTPVLLALIFGDVVMVLLTQIQRPLFTDFKHLSPFIHD